MDNQNSLWEAYGIEYWPTQMIFDRNGTLRKTIIGEGHDDEVSAIVQSLIDSVKGATTSSRPSRAVMYKSQAGATMLVNLPGVDIHQFTVDPASAGAA